MQLHEKSFEGIGRRGKCYGEIASEVRELAVRAADEEDVRERLAVEAFLEAIPWPFAKEILMKKIENLEEALEETRTRRALEAEEEGRRKPVHAAVEGGTMPEQGQDGGPRRDRRPRRDPVCWGVERLAMCLGSARCDVILRRIAEGGKKVKLERGSLGTYVAPTRMFTSGVIYEEIVVTGVMVRALVDSGASTSCCTRKCYQQEVGPLQRGATKIVGVGNIPINVDRGIGRLPLEWNDAKSFLTLLVIPTLEEPDMILGMDVLQRLGVKINTKTGTAQPTMLITKLKPEESWKVPA